MGSKKQSKIEFLIMDVGRWTVFPLHFSSTVQICDFSIPSSVCGIKLYITAKENSLLFEVVPLEMCK